ncbi:MAG: aspartyl/asparaginyl beta-hydroxylase domain-containing protein [Pseudomonadota bacterium]
MLDWRVILVAVFVSSALYVHYRGTVRHKFARQLTDHSTLLAPINAPIYMFSAVKNSPYLERSAFPELDLLKNNWEIIRDEGMALYSDGAIKGAGADPDAGFHSFFRNGWKRYYLKWYGKPHASAAKTCPKTVELLQSIPGIKAAMFATLPPGGYLGAHRDPYAGSLRYHLGLVTPNDDRCNIVVDGETYSWRDGEDVIFDETYIHHARNDSDKNRLILFCDLERPTNNPLARWYNKFMSKVIMSASATSNEPGEPVGAINRLFSFIYPIRLKFKALKKYNRTLYYVVKWVLMGGGLIALFVLPNL